MEFDTQINAPMGSTITIGAFPSNAVFSPDGRFAVHAPNAFCLAEIKIPKTYDKPEFMDARRKNLPETLASVAADIPVERYGGFPIDAKFLYERNLGDLRSLAGRKIALIGCGTIGGFLAA